MLLWFCAVISILTWCFVKSHFKGWTRKGFPTIPCSIPLGNLVPVALKKKCIGVQIHDLYFSSNAPFAGLYLFFRPGILIRDPDLVKRVLVTDFDHFFDRGVHYDEKNDPIGANFFGMRGQKWKKMRAKLSTTFTPVRQKSMFPVVAEQVKLCEEILRKRAGQSGIQLGIKEVMSSLLVNITARIFFGFELNCFDEPDHEFRQMGQEFFKTSPRTAFNHAAFFLCPALFNLFKMSFLSPKVSSYALNLVRTMMQMRYADPSTVRNDFIQIMLEFMQQQDSSVSESDRLTMEKCAATVLIFYIGAYETSSSAISFCMHELGKSAEHFSTARQEVDEWMEKNGGKLNYESLNELPFLDMCIKEALRMYPAVPLLNRECTKDYLIPGTDLVIEKGTPIIIPNFALQMDPKFFPDPHKFDPYRFQNDDSTAPYYPFGDGPRYCIGARLAHTIMRSMLAVMVHNFDFKAVHKDIEFETGTITLLDKNGVQMFVKNREDWGA